MKIAYCGYDFFHGCMVDLLDAGHQIVRLFTWPVDNEYKFNRKVINTANAYQIPVQMTQLGSNDLAVLQTLGCEALVTACYPGKIPEFEPFLKYGLNIHPAALPEGRGPWPLPCAILKGLSTFGVTIHKLSSIIDAGDILLQEEFPISPSENLETLSAKSQLGARKLLRKFVSDPEAIWRNARPQSLGPTDKSCYWRMPSQADRTLDWTLPVTDLDRIVRAFGKFNCYAVIGGQIVSIQSASLWIEPHIHQPGAVVHEMSREVVIAVADGFACVRFFQPGFMVPGDYFPPRPPLRPYL